MRKVLSLALLLVFGAAGAIGILPVQPASAQATGAFYTQNSKIYDPSGKEFIPVGGNLLGPNDMNPIQANRQFGMYDHTGTKGEIDALTMSDEVEDWNWNTVRLNIKQSKYGLDPTKRVYTDPDFVARMDAIVEEYTAKEIVIIPELHELTNANPVTSGMLDAVIDFWLWAANRYQDNPYVWFNIVNEPNFPNYTAWSDFHTDAISQIRATGADNLIVIDSMWAGQDRNWETWITGTDLCTELPHDESTFLGYSEDVRQASDNIVFSVHIYDVWGRNDCTAQQHRDRLTEYVNGVRALGVPLIVGEAGHELNPATNGERAAAMQALYSLAEDLRLGILAWSAQDGNTPPNPGSYGLVLSGNFYEVGANQSNLSAFGQLHWEYGQVMGALTNEPAPGGSNGGGGDSSGGDNSEDPGRSLADTGEGRTLLSIAGFVLMAGAVAVSRRRNLYRHASYRG